MATGLSCWSLLHAGSASNPGPRQPRLLPQQAGKVGNQGGELGSAAARPSCWVCDSPLRLRPVCAKLLPADCSARNSSLLPNRRAAEATWAQQASARSTDAAVFILQAAAGGGQVGVKQLFWAAPPLPIAQIDMEKRCTLPGRLRGAWQHPSMTGSWLVVTLAAVPTARLAPPSPQN